MAGKVGVAVVGTKMGADACPLQRPCTYINMCKHTHTHRDPSPSAVSAAGGVLVLMEFCCSCRSWLTDTRLSAPRFGWTKESVWNPPKVTADYYSPQQWEVSSFSTFVWKDLESKTSAASASNTTSGPTVQTFVFAYAACFSTHICLMFLFLFLSQAFGNAKTAHNNNSSRFGKFIQVNYLENGVVRGWVINTVCCHVCVCLRLSNALPTVERGDKTLLYISELSICSSLGYICAFGPVFLLPLFVIRHWVFVQLCAECLHTETFDHRLLLPYSQLSDSVGYRASCHFLFRLLSREKQLLCTSWIHTTDHSDSQAAI